MWIIIQISKKKKKIYNIIKHCPKQKHKSNRIKVHFDISTTRKTEKIQYWQIDITRTKYYDWFKQRQTISHQ